MAKDMRTIACCLKMNTYLTRIGRYGKDIAKVTDELHDVPRMKKLVSIPHMAQIVCGMIGDVLTAFVREDISTIQSGVKIKEWDLTEKGCSAIRVQFNRFQKLNIKPPEFQLIIMDPLVHEFYVETGAGRLDIHTYDWKSALVSWALQTRQALDNCIRVKSRDR